jgi:hypothetical protein
MAAHRVRTPAWLAGELARLGVSPEEATDSTAPEGDQAAGGSVPVLRSPVETGPVAEEAESAPTWAGARRISAAGRGWLPLAGVVALTAVATLCGLRALVGGRGVAISSTFLPAPADAGALAGGHVGLASRGRRCGGGRSAAGARRARGPIRGLGPQRGAVPAAVGAAARAITACGGDTRSRALRAWAALVWAAAPCLLVAVGAGRLGAVLAHALMPLVALGLARTVGIGGTGRGSLAAASGTGLALTAVLAGAPALAGPAVLAVLVVALVARTGRALL